MKSIIIFLCDMDYIFLNYFVNNIPCWTVRKILYLLHGMKIGKKSRINMKCIIYAPWKIRIGERSIINEYVLLDGRGKLNIGSDVSISMFSIIYSASHSSRAADFTYYTKPVEIKSKSWLGARCIIMPGSIVEEEVIISVGSVFSGKSQPGKIYRGNPAIEEKDRNLEQNFRLNTKMYWK